ncbi:low affinity iron permease family protein [Nitrospira sp. Nam74]
MANIILAPQQRAAFDQFAKRVECWMGQPMAFGVAVCLCILWALTGPLFGFSNAWQLVINTATTIVTFLMVFLIQSTTNRSSNAIQLKLDELIRANDNANNAYLTLENLTLEDLERVKRRYEELAQLARTPTNQGHPDIGTPSVSL